MNQWFKIENKNGNQDIYIYEEIGLKNTSSKALISQLDKMDKNKPINFHINSPGGNYFDIVTLLSWLKNWTGQKIAYVEGLTASAASYLLTGMDRVLAFDNSMVMVHDVMCGNYGNAKSFEELASNLKKVSTGLIEAYQRKTGQPIEVVKSWIENGDTWFTAKEALDVNLVDALVGKNLKNCYYNFENFKDLNAKRIQVLTDKINLKFGRI